jgi:hypothetical protein
MANLSAAGCVSDSMPPCSGPASPACLQTVLPIGKWNVGVPMSKGLKRIMAKAGGCTPPPCPPPLHAPLPPTPPCPPIPTPPCLCSLRCHAAAPAAAAAVLPRLLRPSLPCRCPSWAGRTLRGATARTVPQVGQAPSAAPCHAGPAGAARPPGTAPAPCRSLPAGWGKFKAKEEPPEGEAGYPAGAVRCRRCRRRAEAPLPLLLPACSASSGGGRCSCAVCP